jgi:hypothetical protein
MKLFFSALILGVLLGVAIPPGLADTPRVFPPVILTFQTDAYYVTVDAVETGQVTATLSWYVTNYTPSYRLNLETYRLNRWASLLAPDEFLPAIGTRTLTVESTLTFSPPSYRLSVIDPAGQVVDERTVLITYDPGWGIPIIHSFGALAASVDAAELAAGQVRIQVSWWVSDRLPTSNLVFEQVFANGGVLPVELPRDNMWVPSIGEGLVAPVLPRGEDQLRLRVSVIDVADGQTYAQMELTLPITGTAEIPLDATGLPIIPATPTLTPIPITPSPTPPLSSTPGASTADVCSEDPYYATAIIAMEWMSANSTGQPMAGDAYGHAQLDGLYQQLYAEGKVGPVPPPCIVTAITDLTVWGHPGVDYITTMKAGETAEVNGQDAAGNWWYVNTGTNWGWVSRQYTQLQPEADISSILVRD